MDDTIQKIDLVPPGFSSKSSLKRSVLISNLPCQKVQIIALKIERVKRTDLLPKKDLKALTRDILAAGAQKRNVGH